MKTFTFDGLIADVQGPCAGTENDPGIVRKYGIDETYQRLWPPDESGEPEFVIFADAAYGLSNVIVAPYDSSAIDNAAREAEKAENDIKASGNAAKEAEAATRLFNHRHSSLRISAECLIGELTTHVSFLLVIQSEIYHFYSCLEYSRPPLFPLESLQLFEGFAAHNFLRPFERPKEQPLLTHKLESAFLLMNAHTILRKCIYEIGVFCVLYWSHQLVVLIQMEIQCVRASASSRGSLWNNIPGSATFGRAEAT